MKKIITLLFVLLVLNAYKTYATLCPAAIPLAGFVSGQTIVCGAAAGAGGLPFGTVNNMTSTTVTSTACASTLYLGGLEVLYTFTPTVTGSVTVNSAGVTYVGITVYNGCPSTAGTTCLGGSGVSAATNSVAVNMTAGTQYYIMFDTYPTPASPCGATFGVNATPPPAADATCATASQVCAPFTFTAGINTTSGGGNGLTYGCLTSQPNPEWHVIQTGPTVGNVNLTISGSVVSDLDYAGYGPFTSFPNNTNTLGAGCGTSTGAGAALCNVTGAPVATAGGNIGCDYTTANGGQFVYLNAPANSYFLILVANFANTANNVTIAPNATNTAPLVCPCVVTSVTATPSACAGGTYSVSGNIAFNASRPTTGTLTISDGAGGSQVFNAPFTSPTAYSIPGITANGAGHTLTATFSALTAPVCQLCQNYNAPAPCAVPACTTAAVPTGALSITQSTCSNPCAAPAGGVIAVGTKACAAGLVLQYSANGGAFSTTIPTYNQTTAVSVGTRCSCTSSGNFSATDAVATVPGNCPAQVAVALSVPVLTVAGCNTALPAAYASVAALTTATGSAAGSGTLTLTSTDATVAGCTTATTRTYTLTKVCGGVTTTDVKTQTINRITDVAAPVIAAAPAAVTVACGGTVPAAAVLSATDNCDATYPKDAVMTETSVVSGCQTVITRKWNTTDLCTNAATERTQTITVNADADAPVIAAAPAAVTVACGGTVPAAATLSATDNCDATYPKDAMMTETSVVFGCQTVITRKWNTTDACTNAATERTQTITVNADADAPVIAAAPAAVTVACGGTVPAAAVLSATDNCDVNYPKSIIAVETSVTSASGCQTVITRKWNTTDLCTNAATERTQTITVNNDADAPVIAAAPAAVTVACGGTVPAAAVLSATDNCDASYPKDAVMTETSVVTGCQTIITRKWNTTDACTNAATERTQTITVNADAVVPEIAAAPADETVLCGGTVPAAAVLSATDNCDATYPKDAVMTETSVVTGCQTVITRKWNTTDACTNAATERTQIITVNADAVVPEIAAAPADVTLACGDAIPAAATLNATDNCDATYPKAATMVETGSTTACDGGVITRTWSTTDACTNAAVVRVQTITVSADAAVPVIDAAPADVSVCSLPAAAVLSATDNCDPSFPKNATMTTDPFVVSTCASYTVTRRWNVSDCKANAATERVQVITVFPDPANFTVATTSGACSGTARVVCGGATVTTVTATSTAPAQACPIATGPAATAPLSYVVNAGTACETTVTGTATATGCPGPDGCLLSVKWLYFDGTAYTGYNMLNWATANEVNNYFFDVQRSKNGVDFENIGRVNGSGTTNETKTYTYKDATPIAGLNIYRLRQIDFDGKFSTSNSVSLYNKMDKFKMLDAYPNPTKLDINVKLFAPTQGNAQIVVRDVAGKVVYTHNQMTASGVNLLTIDASNFAEGMYMILAIDAKTGASSSIKFIKD